MRRLIVFATVLLSVRCTAWAQVTENLDRGLVVMRQAEGVCYVGWRLRVGPG